MIERKAIFNCSANVVARIDLSSETMRTKIAQNLASLNCPKAGIVVKIEGSEFLFGTPMNIKCMHKECPFNKDRVQI